MSDDQDKIILIKIVLKFGFGVFVWLSLIVNMLLHCN